MFKLYYYPNNASLAPHFILHHVQADYQLELVDKKNNGQKSAEYLRLNPAGRIPTLVVDEMAIFESAAICIHLSELYPEYKLIPALGDPIRPLYFQWLAYLNNTLQAELMVYYYAHRHTTDAEAIPGVVAAQEERIAEALSIVDAQLKDTPYLLGDYISACDYFLFMLAEWSLPIKKSPKNFEFLAKYLKRMTENPSIITVSEIEGIDLSSFQ